MKVVELVRPGKDYTGTLDSLYDGDQPVIQVNHPSLDFPLPFLLSFLWIGLGPPPTFSIKEAIFFPVKFCLWNWRNEIFHILSDFFLISINFFYKFSIKCRQKGLLLLSSLLLSLLLFECPTLEMADPHFQ